MTSILQDIHGPDWPLGFIEVITPGLPVGIMSLVDPAGINDPSTPTPLAGVLPAHLKLFTVRAQQVWFQARKPNTHGTKQNSGNIYIVREPDGSGDGNRDDTGVILYTLEPGQTLFLASAPVNNDVYSPYRYRIDADVSGDGAFVTLIIQ